MSQHLRRNCCELRLWLHCEVKTRFSLLVSHGECSQQHAEFHVEVAKIATAVNASKFTQSDAMFNAGTAYAQVPMAGWFNAGASAA